MTPRQQFGFSKILPRCHDGCQCKYCYLLDVLEWDEICRMIIESDDPISGWLDLESPKYIGLAKDQPINGRITHANFFPMLAVGMNLLNVHYDVYIDAWIDRAI